MNWDELTDCNSAHIHNHCCCVLVDFDDDNVTLACDDGIDDVVDVINDVVVTSTLRRRCYDHVIKRTRGGVVVIGVVLATTSSLRGCRRDGCHRDATTASTTTSSTPSSHAEIMSCRGRWQGCDVVVVATRTCTYLQSVCPTAKFTPVTNSPHLQLQTNLVVKWS